MAKLQMKRIRLLALRKDRKPLMEKLQRLGAVEIEAEEQPPDGFDRLDMDAQAQGFERSAQTARQALDYLKERLPEKQGLLAALSGRREVSEEELDAAAGKSAAVMKDCQRVLTIQRQLAEEAAERVRLRAAAAQLEAWEGLDVSFRFSGTRSTAAFIAPCRGCSRWKAWPPRWRKATRGCCSTGRCSPPRRSRPVCSCCAPSGRPPPWSRRCAPWVSPAPPARPLSFPPRKSGGWRTS